MKRDEQILIFCPIAVTGGPEAIHQLAQIANELGVKSQIVYYGGDAKIRIEGANFLYQPPSSNRCLAAYQKYNPIVASNLTFNETTLVILPEVLFQQVLRFAPADVAIWWLSVDNAFHPNSLLLQDQYRRDFFANDRIIHLCQTFYSRALLRSHQVNKMYDLVDYTDDLFTLVPPRAPNKSGPIAYNPRKGHDLAAKFFEANPEIEQLPIRGMTKAQVYTLFRKTQIYLEFGHNPGKDRMPREAACAGCIVLARNKGGTAYFDDTPLDTFFKFDDEEVISGSLAKKVLEIAATPDRYWSQQAYYRRYLYTERELMRLQAKRLFGS